MYTPVSRALPTTFAFDAKGSPRGNTIVGELPTWPLYALYIGFPLWWYLGLGDMIWPVFALPMLINLILRGHVTAPRGFGVWLLFVAWMSITVIQVDSVGRVVGFAFRAMAYVAATIIFLYVYNSSTRSLPLSRLANTLTVFWGVVVAGGFLGVMLPGGSFNTLMGTVLPNWLQSNDVVAAMVRPHFAQYTPFSGTFTAPRPSAPFLYTNNWGNNYSLLLPFVLIALTLMPRGPLRWLVTAMIPVSFIPAFLTLNRGMFLALAVGFVYIAIRFAFRKQVAGLIAVGLLVALAAGLTLVLPVQDLMSARVSSSDTNETRTAVYQEALDRTKQSPILGYGAPRPSDSTAGAPAVGTQGQFWMVLFSHGFPGAVLFVGWLVILAWRTRRAISTPTLWLHVVCVMSLLECFYYGMLSSGLILLMIAGAAALRETEGKKLTGATT
jgi:hypothetical protein